MGSGGVPTGEVSFEGLASGIAGDGEIILSWRPAHRAVSAYAVFAADDPGPVDFSAPLAVAPADATSFVLAPVPNGVAKHLAVRALFVDPPVDANEAVHLALPNPVRLVDDGSNAGPLADGLTPWTAYPGLSEAFASEGPGRNFRLVRGAYPASMEAPPFTGIYGGFLPTFDLASRDPEEHRTILTSPVGGSAVGIGPGGGLLVLDGLLLQGTAEPSGVGILVVDAAAFVSNCTVTGFSSDGVHLSGNVSPPARARLFLRRDRIVANGGEGIGLGGFFDAVIGESVIEGNANEGIEADDFTPVADEEAGLDVVRCVVRANGDDGIDIDFAPADPLAPGSSKDARPRVRVVGNRVLGNGERGIFLDLDFAAADDIDAAALVVGNEVRRNVLEGVLLDFDAPGLFVLRGNRITANLGGGLRLDGEASEPAATVYSLNDFIAGNAGDGLAAAAVAASGVVANGAFLGNLAAGIAVLGAPPCATSCVLDRNGDDLLAGASASFSLVSDGDPGLGNFAADPLFVHAPVVYGFVLSSPAPNRIVVQDPDDFEAGDRVELGDDGSIRTVSSVDGATLRYSPALATVAPAGLPVWNYASSDDPDEDLRFLPGSPATDAGHPLLPDADGSPGDLGPAGGLFGGRSAPDADAAVPAFPFAVRAISPSTGSTVASLGPLAVTFSDPVDPASVNAGTFLVVGPDGIVPGNFVAIGLTAVFLPSASPAAPATVEVALTGGVHSLDGRNLFHPFLARISVAGP